MTTTTQTNRVVAHTEVTDPLVLDLCRTILDLRKQIAGLQACIREMHKILDEEAREHEYDRYHPWGQGY